MAGDLGTCVFARTFPRGRLGPGGDTRTPYRHIGRSVPVEWTFGSIVAVIDLETTRHVARLARLRLEGAEEVRMQAELNGILGHIDQIQALELDGVAPTSHVIALRNVLRDDVPRPSLSREAALHEAPEVIDGGFGVPSLG